MIVFLTILFLIFVCFLGYLAAQKHKWWYRIASWAIFLLFAFVTLLTLVGTWKVADWIVLAVVRGPGSLLHGLEISSYSRAGLILSDGTKLGGKYGGELHMFTHLATAFVVLAAIITAIMHILKRFTPRLYQEIIIMTFFREPKKRKKP